MIYVLEDNEYNDNETFTVKAPDNIDHQMATKVILKNQDKWSLKEITHDDSYISATHHHELVEILPPDLFINRDENDKLVPDMTYLPVVDKSFMTDMLYYWSSCGRKADAELVDEIEDNLDFLLNSCVVINILE